MRLLLLAFSILAPPTWAQLNYDESLEKACKYMNGQWKQRVAPQSITGDKCTMQFKVAVRDQNDANEFCELYAPWRLEKAVIKTDVSGRSMVECTVEATVTCKKGWTQMFGHCFMTPDKHNTFTYDEAVTKCASAEGGAVKARIAFLHHRYIVGVWRRFFTGIGQIWVDATEPWDRYVQKTNTVDGDHMALAFNGWHYNFKVHPNSLIRIQPKIKLQVICEYKPELNAAEINYLGRRYSEIYYPAVPVDYGVLVRSASSYTRSTKNVDICEKTLKPYMQLEKIKPFVPSKEDTMPALSSARPELMWLSRAGAEAQRLASHVHERRYCQHIIERFEVKVIDDTVGDFLISDLIEDKITCDHMLSTAITQFPGEEAKVRIMSDSRSLPVWCKLGRPAKFSVDKPDHYHVFDRVNGEFVAHRLFQTPLTYENAKKRCEQDGAVLTGINSKKEADFLKKIADDEGHVKNHQMWLGGRRKPECVNVLAFQKTGKCTRNKVIEWENNVAQEFFDDWWKDAPNLLNPDYAGSSQQCLTFVYGNPDWADVNSNGFLDDIGCELNLGFYCTIKLKVNVVYY